MGIVSAILTPVKKRRLSVSYIFKMDCYVKKKGIYLIFRVNIMLKSYLSKPSFGSTIARRLGSEFEYSWKYKIVFVQ